MIHSIRLLALMLLLVPALALGQSADGPVDSPIDGPIKVGITEVPPFVMESETGKWEGIGSGFWWAAVTMTTVGYGDKAPTSMTGRIVALVWMFAGLIMVASFTAAITSSLTVSNLRSQIQGPDDLIRANVATIANTASEQYLQDQRIRHQEYPDLTSAMQSVAQGETDAVVYDRSLLQYRNLQMGEDRLTLLPSIFQKQLYALALPAGSPLRDAVSEQILTVTEADSWQTNVRRYLGQD